MTRFSEKCDNFSDFVKEFLEKQCTFFFKLFCSGKEENTALKIAVGFLYGFLLGLAFYELILVDLNFTENAAYVVGGIISAMLTCGITISSHVRCITLLSVPIFGGRAGRGVLKAIVFAYIIAGPIENLSNNGREVVRVFSCTTSLTFNLTKTRFELMFKPFTQALFGLKSDVTEVKDTIRSIRDVSAPIIGEVEDEAEMEKLKEENDYADSSSDDSSRSKAIEEKYQSRTDELEAKRYEKMYLKKIEMRCEDQFTRAGNNCKNMFQKGYDTCYDTVTWLASWLLCWPMKLTFVCNIMQALGGAGRCDPSKDIDAGFGEGYAYLKQSQATLSENFKDVKIQYQAPKIKELIDFRDASDTANAVLHTVQAKKDLLDAILVLLKRTLALVFLRIIINAQNYHDKYLKDIEFDNFYITKYFRHIDARRHRVEKKTLLPLKKVEKNKVIDPWNFSPLKMEKEELLGQTVKLLLEIITATTFVILDRLFYEALDLVRRHAKIDYMQSGQHDMLLLVKGTGMIASLLRSVVKGFNVKKRIRTVRSNEACLPRPTVLQNYYLYKIYGTYLAVWLLILMQAYINRTRRIICSFFYQKREKQRVIFLYNETLKRRVSFFRYMKKKVKKLAREQRLQENLNVFSALRIWFPKSCDCLRFFAMSRRKCIICGEPELRKPSKVEGDFEKCKTPNCFVVHCAECWFDMGKKCFACTEDSSGNESGEFPDSDKGYNDSDY